MKRGGGNKTSLVSPIVHLSIQRQLRFREIPKPTSLKVDLGLGVDIKLIEPRVHGIRQTIHIPPGMNSQPRFPTSFPFAGLGLQLHALEHGTHHFRLDELCGGNCYVNTTAQRHLSMCSNNTNFFSELC